MAAYERCPDHGSRYSKGCEGCRKSMRDYQARRRAENKRQQPPKVVAPKPERTRTPEIADPYRRVSIVEGDLEWHQRAACRDIRTEIFFPDSEGRGKGMAWDFALRICATCPVTEPCLAYALRTNQREGVWGGKTPSQRQRLPKPDPLCCDCGHEYPKTAGSGQRCDSCQVRWRRRRQYQWHHEVGKFRREVAS